MTERSFLWLAEVLAIHRDQIQRYGGSPGVRDWRLLISALAMPAASYDGQYLHTNLPEMAAAYLYHLVQNHPFVDGNKRVGAVAADVFLTLNNAELQAGQDEFAELVLSVARGKAGKSAVAEFLRARIKYST